jgi:hypothetical protein
MTDADSEASTAPNTENQPSPEADGNGFDADDAAEGGAGGPAPDAEPDAEAETVAEAVTECLDRQAALDETLGDLERAWCRGEAVQAEVEAVFDRVEGLETVARLDYGESLGDRIDDAVRQGALSADQRERFAAWWETVDWVVPGIAAYTRTNNSACTHWTRKELDLQRVNGQAVAEWTLWYGLDEAYAAQVPVATFFDEAATRLQYLAQLLPAVVEHGDIDPDDLAGLLRHREGLAEVADRLETLADEAPGDDDADDGSSGPRFDPSTGGMVDDSPAGSDSNTGGDGEEGEEGDESEAARRMFQ